jgi:hypothetical protein
MDKHISKHPETQHLASDVVHYREYKILLQPDRFTSKNGFIEFWEAASKTLKKLHVKVDVDDHAFDSQVREVLFYDTPAIRPVQQPLHLAEAHLLRSGMASSRIMS